MPVESASPTQAARPQRADARSSVERIIVTARAVLAEDPYASLQEVAKASGVHRATVYRHFASREELISQLYARWLDDVSSAVTGLDADAPDLLAELRRVTRAVYDVNLTWKAFAWAPAFPAHFAASRDEMISAIKRAFARGRDEGLLRSDMSVSELHTAWGAPIQYLSSRILDGSWTLDDAVDFTVRLVTPQQ